MALEAAETEIGPVFMLGDIVHNEHVVQELDEAGIRVVNGLDEMTQGGTLLIRAHGSVPEIYEGARARGLNIVDATCPLVLDIHETAIQLHQEGYTIVIIGDHGHDEVIGIAGQVKAATVIASPKEVETKIKRLPRLGVVVQSTQDIENVQRIVYKLAGLCRELKFFNTICPPTTRHQQEIRELPLEHDVIIIIGSHNSANTCRLTSIATQLNPRTYQVQSAEELQREWFLGAQSVGVSAGASTPEVIITEVIARIQAMTA